MPAATSPYLYLLGVFFPFILIPCIFGILGIMVLMRYFPTDQAHQILSFMGLFFFAGLVMFLRFLSPEKFFDKQVSDEMIIAFVETLKAPEFGFLPSSWITRGVSQWPHASKNPVPRFTCHSRRVLWIWKYTS